MIGFSALSGFGLALLLFLSRLFSVVTPYSRAYSPVIWTFFWVFGLALIMGDVFLVCHLYLLTHTWALGLHWLFTVGAFFALLVFGAIFWVTLCVGMNFMGQ